MIGRKSDSFRQNVDFRGRKSDSFRPKCSEILVVIGGEKMIFHVVVSGHPNESIPEVIFQRFPVKFD